MRISDWSSDVCSSDLDGRTLASTGVLRARASKRSRSSGNPQRRAMAIRCTTALVEPDRASTVRTALSNDAAVNRLDGVTSCHNMSTMSLTAKVDIWTLLETGAGIDAQPERPLTSAPTAKRKHNNEAKSVNI